MSLQSIIRKAGENTNHIKIQAAPCGTACNVTVALLSGGNLRTAFDGSLALLTFGGLLIDG